MTTIVTATEYTNFFHQRCHKDAQPEFRMLALMMAEQYYEISHPTKVHTGDYHLPYIRPDEQGLDTRIKIKVSVARCARVSYLQQDGKRDYTKDVEMYENRLIPGGHWSPFEHVAKAIGHASELKSGNFKGWHQWRKEFQNECNGQFDWTSVKADMLNCGRD
jgi:thymidylate synthase ThyX